MRRDAETKVRAGAMGKGNRQIAKEFSDELILRLAWMIGDVLVYFFYAQTRTHVNSMITVDGTVTLPMVVLIGESITLQKNFNHTRSRCVSSLNCWN